VITACRFDFCDKNERVDDLSVKFLIIKPTRCTNLCKYVDDQVSDPAGKLSANLYDIYHCRVYSEKLLMMDRGTV
jgi:hypothetical protein